MELAPNDLAQVSWTAWILPLSISCLCGFAAAATMAWALRRSAVTPQVFKALIAGEFVVVSAAVLYVASSYANLSLLMMR